MVKTEWLAPDDTVRVTEDDCIYAVKANQYSCAIARAIWRKYPNARLVRVNKKTISFSIDEERFFYPTPESTVESIIKPLDTGGKPEPGLVRLKGGHVKPVNHTYVENNRVQNDRDKYVEKGSKRSRNQNSANYGRFE